MNRQLWLPSLLIFLAGVAAHADTCPILEGTFRCRTKPKFEISVQQENQNYLSVYTLIDPKTQHQIIPDGQFHPFELDNGEGQYRASCQRNRLIVELQDNQGRSVTDQYYIERAALVRLRFSHNKATSLSCAPTRGTWRRYSH